MDDKPGLHAGQHLLTIKPSYCNFAEYSLALPYLNEEGLKKSTNWQRMFEDTLCPKPVSALGEPLQMCRIFTVPCAVLHLHTIKALDVEVCPDKKLKTQVSKNLTIQTPRKFSTVP